MEPTGIILERSYVLPDDLESKTAHWGEILWSLLRREAAIELPRSLRNLDEFDFINIRLTNYLLSRLIVQGIVVFRKHKDLDDDTLQSKLEDVVDDLLNLSEPTRDQVVSYVRLICERLDTNAGASLTKNQNRRIKAFAGQKGHRCYICGQQLTYEEQSINNGSGNGAGHNARAFEVDHIFPQSRGGGRGTDNLAASCNSCNKIKGHSINYADFPIEKALTKSESPNNIKADVASAEMKFALLWKQKGACALCGVHFYAQEDEQLHIFKKNTRDTYHFLNTQIVCVRCVEEHDLDGVLVRE
ncbi:HNH endonuclease [Ensifer sp. R-19]|uniref:HNH endonuclease n=1 Tax=Ensifer sp. R-19 TaxID=3404055 RepID=UPI003CE99E19